MINLDFNNCKTLPIKHIRDCSTGTPKSSLSKVKKKPIVNMIFSATIIGQKTFCVWWVDRLSLTHCVSFVLFLFRCIKLV